MSGWRDCIVVFFDLAGTKKLAAAGPKGSDLQRSFHRLICEQMRDGFHSIDHAYIWNDSVLLLAYPDDEKTYEQIMHAADDLKRVVDKHCSCYAIAVKGQAFPAIGASFGEPPSRVTVLRTSSYAMANCFAIEEEARKRKIRKQWYVDARIARAVKISRSPTWFALRLLPRGKCRRIYTHSGYIWSNK